MKIFIFLALVGLLHASVDREELDVQEGEELVKEDIELDAEKGTQKYHTGDHCGRKGATEFIDSQNGYVARKFDHNPKRSFSGKNSMENYCVVRPYNPKTDLDPVQAKDALKKAHNKMPKEVIEIEDFYIMRDYKYMGADKPRLPQSIVDFCEGLQIGIKKVVKDKEEAAKEQVKEMLAHHKNGRKRAILREFNACTNKSTMMANRCMGPKLRAKCDVRKEGASCVYQIKCPLDLQKGGFNCRGLHKYDSAMCCDYWCDFSS